MPLYNVLYCGIGVNYRRLMLEKRFLGNQKLSSDKTEVLNHGFVTSTDLPTRVQIQNISVKNLIF